MMRLGGAPTNDLHCSHNYLAQPKEHDTTGLWLKSQWYQFASRTVTHRYTVCHAYEINQAINGDRTMLPWDKQLWEKALVICGLKESKNPEWLYLGVECHRCANQIRQRLDALLAILGRPPLMQPRSHCQPTMAWAVYAALQIDPGNITQWCDEFVNLDGLPENCYVYQACRIKLQSFQELEKLGFAYTGRMKKNSLKLLHLAMDIIKYTTFNAKRKDNYYGKSIDTANDKITKAIKALMTEAEIHYFAKPDYEHDRKAWREKFIVAARVAFWYLQFT